MITGIMISHKITLFHTAAHCRGSIGGGQAIFREEIYNFCNVVNDLANILKKTSKNKISKNYGLRVDSECDASYLSARFMFHFDNLTDYTRQ